MQQSDTHGIIAGKVEGEAPAVPGAHNHFARVLDDHAVA
jgi:hypothetical protein